MKIAILEDDISMRKSLEYSLADYDITCFKNPIDALNAGIDEFDLFISDINMPKMDGIEFIKAAKQAGSNADFIIITGNASLQKSIEALRLGVRDFLTKPFSIDELEAAIKTVQKVQTALANAKSPKRKKPTEASGAKSASKSAQAKSGLLAQASGDEALIDEFFIAHSKSLDEAISMAMKAAKTDISVMLNGPSGSGKEVFAKFIHASSHRAKGPFMAINMAALPEALCESELFGYCKGAFTDAVKDKDGLFKLADGGTLFLDEIGEMSTALQAKLLRAIQERKITPLGSNKSIDINVRIISATNINIQQNIKNQQFRSDLFYRLNAFSIQLAPLKERKEEILPLFTHFYEQACQNYQTPICELEPEAKKALLEYEFAGNVRELISIAQRSAILAEGSIKVADLCLLNY